MDFMLIIVLSVVLTIVFFSSGITVINANHLGVISAFGKLNKFYRWIAKVLLSVIAVTARVRCAWIRMISPGGDADS